MKIYTRVVIDSLTGKIEEEDSFEYDGQIAELKDSPAPPPSPDYVGAAKEQGAANKESAIATSQMGNPNVTNPYGGQTVTYKNDPTTGNPIPNINQYLSPSGQELFDQYQGINKSLGDVAQIGVGYVQNQLDKPFDQSALPAAPVNAGQTYGQAAMGRLQPQIDRENSMSDAQLANQGIMRGSEAYNSAKTLLGNQHNDLLQQVSAGSLNADQAARSSAIQEQSFFRNDPLNTLNAVRSAAPVNVPQFQGYSGANVGAAPVFNAAAAQQQSNMGLYNAQVGTTNSNNQALMQLGGSGLGAYAAYAALAA